MKKVTVEILRDSDSPNINIEPVVAGVEYTSRFVRGIEVVDNKRTVRLGASAVSSALFMVPMVSPQLRHPLSVVATNKHLEGNSSNFTSLGRTFSTKDHAFAVIDTTTEYPSMTAAHEMGHVVGLKYSGRHGPHHCRDIYCLMAPSMNKYLPPSTPLSNRERMLARAGIYTPEVQRETILNDSFCEQCEGELAKHKIPYSN